MSLAEEIKEWAKEKYEESHGASCLIECYTDAELEQEFTSVPDAKRWAALLDDAKADIEAMA